METLASPVNAPKRVSWQRSLLLVLLVAGAIHLACIVSPPSLMDDVDAVQAQIPRNMLTSGDWVTARLDGVIYLEKSPLMYWLIALFYKALGVHDWVARIPIALSSIGLAWITAAFGRWAFGARAGLYAGLAVGSSIGLFLFTRILIPDNMLTLTIALTMWAFLRVLDEEEKRPRLWAYLFFASIAVSLLLKSLVGIVFPLGAAFVYLALTRQLFSRQVWARFYPLTGALLLLVIAVPWHLLATLRNRPYFAWTMHSGPGQWHGFLWFYFINEQLLRFLNLRFPPDYSTVPRVYFWLFNLIWLFPWSVYLPAAIKLNYKPINRAGRTRLLALCWTGFLLVFFTFSSTQEYYSMPCYPALALLIGSAMATDDNKTRAWLRGGTRVLTAITAVCAITCLAILFYVRHTPSPGDISDALSHQATYKLSLGHMQDLTLDSFAYLRLPLVLAAIAFGLGAIGTVLGTRGSRSRESTGAFLSAALMMVVFFQAARLAMVTFDPYLSSRPLARVILAGPPGRIVVDTQYWLLSSIAFYTNRPELLLNGRWNNLEYGSNAPGAPDVFINDPRFAELWRSPERFYLVTKEKNTPRLQRLVGHGSLILLARSGGKLLFTNEPTSSAQ